MKVETRFPFVRTYIEFLVQEFMTTSKSWSKDGCRHPIHCVRFGFVFFLSPGSILCSRCLPLVSFLVFRSSPCPSRRIYSLNVSFTVWLNKESFYDLPLSRVFRMSLTSLFRPVFVHWTWWMSSSII